MGQVIELRTFASAAPGPRARVEVESHQPAVRTTAVYVVFTSTEATLAAMRTGSELARAMGVPLTLLHFRTIPYPAPVDAPTGVSPVETDAFKAQLLAEGIDATVQVCLCRDAYQAASQRFPSRSLIVVGGLRHGWWGSPAMRLRRTLEAKGHVVIAADEAAREEHSDA